MCPLGGFVFCCPSSSRFGHAYSFWHHNLTVFLEQFQLMSADNVQPVKKFSRGVVVILPIKLLLTTPCAPRPLPLPPPPSLSKSLVSLPLNGIQESPDVRQLRHLSSGRPIFKGRLVAGSALAEKVQAKILARHTRRRVGTDLILRTTSDLEGGLRGALVRARWWPRRNEGAIREEWRRNHDRPRPSPRECAGRRGNNRRVQQRQPKLPPERLSPTHRAGAPGCSRRRAHFIRRHPSLPEQRQRRRL